MRLRPWQILSLIICFASELQSQEVRRALPIAPTPEPAPRALPVHPDQIPRQQSILDENIPSSQSAEPRRSTENTPEAKSSAGSPAEPDSKTRDEAEQDEIRLTPNQGQDSEIADPAKAQLAVADGLDVRRCPVSPTVTQISARRSPR